MDKLENLCKIEGATEKDYTLIAKIAGVDKGIFVHSAMVRGGCFFSARYNIPIPGKLSKGSGRPVTIKEFIVGLKKIKS